MKTNTIDWEAFFWSVRKFPDLRQVVVQCGHDTISGPYLREILVEFVAHMRSDEWAILEGLLGLYHDIWEGEWTWVQVQLDDVMDDIKLKVWFLSLSNSSPFGDSIDIYHLRHSRG